MEDVCMKLRGIDLKVIRRKDQSQHISLRHGSPKYFDARRSRLLPRCDEYNAVISVRNSLAVGVRKFQTIWNRDAHFEAILLKTSRFPC